MTSGGLRVVQWVFLGGCSAAALAAVAATIWAQLKIRRTLTGRVFVRPRGMPGGAWHDRCCLVARYKSIVEKDPADPDGFPWCTCDYSHGKVFRS